MIKIKAQRWVALIAVIALLFVLVQIVGIVRRNAQYDRILKTYSEVLKPGMKRSRKVPHHDEACLVFARLLRWIQSAARFSGDRS
jgi:hypothetical protein